MDEYKNKKILVIGLGFSGGGVGVAKFLLKKGAYVTVVDIKSKKELESSLKALGRHKNLSFSLGEYPKNIGAFDLVVLNPAVDLRSPFVKKIRRAGIPIESELGLFLKHCRSKVIAITGTKGKGTTATLVYEILKKAKEDVLLGGNIGVSLLEKLPRISKNTFVVLEISSFQLDLLSLDSARDKHAFRFYISVLANIYPDHLDRYNSFSDYKKSKLSILKHPARFKIDGRKIAAKLPAWIDARKIQLIGEHNRKNIALAVEIVKHLHIKKEIIAKAIHDFRGLPHRLEYLGPKKGIAFYNDSYSTTPDSTIVALQSFKTLQGNSKRSRGTAQKVILIAGGVSKGASFKNLARIAGKRAKAVILFGQSAREIKRSFGKIGSPTSATSVNGSRTSIAVVKTLKEAVRKAKKIAAKGDIILFSPACASFDQFRNARERGEMFKKFVRGK